VSLESTTYPGTTEEELLPRIESTDLKVGEDIFLVYSPEREDPGNTVFTTRNIPKVLGGITPACLEVGRAMYGHAIDQLVEVSSTKVAEMTKLLENIHRAVNIGLINELKIVSDRMGIDIHEVIRAASTKPFGFIPYYPGPGLGGHCIPIDPFYLAWKAREYNVHTRFIELAGEVNSSMPRWVTGKVIDALNDCGKSLNNCKVLILGVAYKRDVDDMRESPSVALMELLEEKGAIVEYTDPYVPFFPKMRDHLFDLTSVNLTPEIIASYDILLLVTDHTTFDYEMIQQNAQLIVDTRGVYQDSENNVIKA
ncbi:MAG: nucleotide sugar dehydrogenase, partial [Anaerolineales bacterium]|nr:nucleotide sugar dehydrogenase [Anaerolineales bacterium]